MPMRALSIWTKGMAAAESDGWVSPNALLARQLARLLEFLLLAGEKNF